MIYRASKAGADGLTPFRSLGASGLIRKIPTSGLVFYAPLAAAAATAETGQTLTEQDSPAYSVCNGIPCLDTTNGYLSSEVLNLQGAAPQTLSIWLKVTSPANVAGALAHGAGGSMSMAAIGAHYNNAFASFYGTSVDYNYGVDVSDKMHHLALTYDGSVARAYIDGAIIRQDTPGEIGIYSDDLLIGSSFGYRIYAYLAAARIYNRVLDADEVAALAAEFQI